MMNNKMAVNCKAATNNGYFPNGTKVQIKQNRYGNDWKLRPRYENGWTVVEHGGGTYTLKNKQTGVEIKRNWRGVAK